MLSPMSSGLQGQGACKGTVCGEPPIPCPSQKRACGLNALISPVIPPSPALSSVVSRERRGELLLCVPHQQATFLQFQPPCKTLQH